MTTGEYDTIVGAVLRLMEMFDKRYDNGEAAADQVVAEVLERAGVPNPHYPAQALVVPPVTAYSAPPWREDPRTGRFVRG